MKPHNLEFNVDNKVLKIKTIKLAGRPIKSNRINFSCFEINKLMLGFKIKRRGYIFYITDNKKEVYEKGNGYYIKLVGEYS